MVLWAVTFHASPFLGAWEGMRGPPGWLPAEAVDEYTKAWREKLEKYGAEHLREEAVAATMPWDAVGPGDVPGFGPGPWL